jgi:hypothetical protein
MQYCESYPINELLKRQDLFASYAIDSTQQHVVDEAKLMDAMQQMKQLNVSMGGEMK